MTRGEEKKRPRGGVFLRNETLQLPKLTQTYQFYGIPGLTHASVRAVANQS